MNILKGTSIVHPWDILSQHGHLALKWMSAGYPWLAEMCSKNQARRRVVGTWNDETN